MKKIFILYFSISLLSIPAISELYALTTQGPSVAINFDNPLPQGSYTSFLNGVFQGIDFGQGKWKWESAYGANSTNHIYFDSPQG